MIGGEPTESPFELPLLLSCAECGHGGEILASPREAPDVASQPREAYRCRVCRRAVVELVLGLAGNVASDPEPEQLTHGAAAEAVARCISCRREARIAWLDDRPSSQQIRLDSLYGRR
jgi:hypothetical protein